MDGDEVIKFALNPIFYNFDKYDIRNDARSILLDNLQILNNNPAVYINIISYTDTRGSSEYNDILSKKKS